MSLNILIPEAHFEIAHLHHQKRRKRSLSYDDQDLVGLKKHLNLQPSPKNSFLDPKFLLLRRWSNTTNAALDQHGDEELDNCYYRSENAAVFACGEVVCRIELFKYLNYNNFFIQLLKSL